MIKTTMKSMRKPWHIQGYSIRSGITIAAMQETFGSKLPRPMSGVTWLLCSLAMEKLCHGKPMENMWKRCGKGVEHHEILSRLQTHVVTGDLHLPQWEAWEVDEESKCFSPFPVTEGQLAELSRVLTLLGMGSTWVPSGNLTYLLNMAIYNVGVAIINHQFLMIYHPFMVIRGIVYYCNTNISVCSH